MATKKDGATTICTQCGANLVCNLKDYGGNYKPTLQWQNYDGTAHYKTADGKNFECNLPSDEEQAQSRIPSIPTTPGDSSPKSPFVIFASLDEKIESCYIKLDRIEQVLEALFRHTVEEQLKKK